MAAEKADRSSNPIKLKFENTRLTVKLHKCLSLHPASHYSYFGPLFVAKMTENGTNVISGDLVMKVLQK